MNMIKENKENINEIQTEHSKEKPDYIGVTVLK